MKTRQMITRIFRMQEGSEQPKGHLQGFPVSNMVEG
jgi:hypothetical protein